MLRLYLDLASPYAYLAVERVRSLIGPVELVPILLGAIFQRRGWGSWAQTDRRAAGMAEVEQRARGYGLPPLRWPHGWPQSSLAADRAATWAELQGCGESLIKAIFRREFTQGAQISDLDVLGECAGDVGLGREELLRAIQRQKTKDALRTETDRAWELGVRGVPSLLVGADLFFGDDRLEQAAERLAGS